jgi:hypothetical protein
MTLALESSPRSRLLSISILATISHAVKERAQHAIRELKGHPKAALTGLHQHVHDLGECPSIRISDVDDINLLPATTITAEHAFKAASNYSDSTACGLPSLTTQSVG